ncbi:MAG: hypothetical protein AB1627_14820 [Chloroflexota bacterium]
MLRAGVAHGVPEALAIALLLVLGSAVFMSPTTARAEGCTGATFSRAVARADAAIVGTISKVAKNANGARYAAAVEVERAWRIETGAVWRGRAYPGLCSCCGTDRPRIGARVVVLLDVSGIDPGRVADVFYTVGITVTSTQVRRLPGTLPDTATAPDAAPASRASSAAPAILLAVVVAAAALLLTSPRWRGRLPPVLP